MGSVSEIRISGDNDTPIFPVRYVMHHLYCDNCGSFALAYWITPDNHAQLRQLQARLKRVAQWALAATILSVVGALLGLIFFLIPALLVLVGALSGVWLLERRIVIRGARCPECETTYAYGSGFFADLEANPRGYTAADIPPLNGHGIRITGQTLGPVEE